MRRIVRSAEGHSIKKIGLLLIIAALIAGMMSCGETRPVTPDFIEVRTWYDLDAIREDMSGSYALMNDLDSTTAGYAELAGMTANEGKGWEPIGTGAFDHLDQEEPYTRLEPFTGTFDGQGYEIGDLFINRPEEYAVGLFGVLDDGGVIRDIGVVNVAVTGGLGVGGLVGGNLYGSTVTGAYATGNVTGVMGVGGLVGGNGYAAIVSNSYSTAGVSGDEGVGGLAGFNAFDATINGAFASGNVTGGWAIGGLVGVNEEGNVSDSHSWGNVSGIGNAGGLAGWNSGTVNTSYASGNVTGEAYVGGLVGQTYQGAVSNSFWDVDASGVEASSGGTGKTTTEMRDISTFTNTATVGLDESWNIVAVTPGHIDFAYTWNIVDGQTYPFLASEQPVYFACPNLETAVRQAIGKPMGLMYASDLEGLTELPADDRSITDLTGLEYCINLSYLYLEWNQIIDISALAGLTNLTRLYLGENHISDISPLVGLTGLTYLSLFDNQISDISPLAGLTSLTGLWLWSNEISDISALAGLISLTELHLARNEISDISPLEGLTDLTDLDLFDNQMSDISPLAGLTNLVYLDLNTNQISDISPLSGLVNLTHLRLEWNQQISDISSLSDLVNLTVLYLSDNQISDISPLEGLTHLTSITLDANQIGDVSPLVENTGLGEGDYVNLRNNPLSEQSINEYIPALQARGVTVDW